MRVPSFFFNLTKENLLKLAFLLSVISGMVLYQARKSQVTRIVDQNDLSGLFQNFTLISGDLSRANKLVIGEFHDFANLTVIFTLNLMSYLLYRAPLDVAFLTRQHNLTIYLEGINIFSNNTDAVDRERSAVCHDYATAPYCHIAKQLNFWDDRVAAHAEFMRTMKTCWLVIWEELLLLKKINRINDQSMYQWIQQKDNPNAKKLVGALNNSLSFGHLDKHKITFIKEAFAFLANHTKKNQRVAFSQSIDDCVALIASEAHVLRTAGENAEALADKINKNTDNSIVREKALYRKINDHDSRRDGLGIFIAGRVHVDAIQSQLAGENQVAIISMNTLTESHRRQLSLHKR